MLHYPSSGHSDERRHDLDWLRVGALGLLIFYHIGMFYVTSDWHVKSPYAGPFLEPLMGLINQWRLGLLFLISGAALRFAMDKAKMGKFLPQRLRRRYLNEAVFPYYILHQTLIVVIGALLIPTGLPLLAEASVLVLGTVAGCAIGYELIRRVKLLRPLFGLSWSGRDRGGALEIRADRGAVERAFPDDDKGGFAPLAWLPGPVEIGGDAGTHGLYGEPGAGTR